MCLCYFVPSSYASLYAICSSNISFTVSAIILLPVFLKNACISLIASDEKSSACPQVRLPPSSQIQTAAIPAVSFHSTANPEQQTRDHPAHYFYSIFYWCWAIALIPLALGSNIVFTQYYCGTILSKVYYSTMFQKLNSGWTKAPPNYFQM